MSLWIIIAVLLFTLPENAKEAVWGGGRKEKLNWHIYTQAQDTIQRLDSRWGSRLSFQHYSRWFFLVHSDSFLANIVKRGRELCTSSTKCQQLSHLVYSLLRRKNHFLRVDKIQFRQVLTIPKGPNSQGSEEEWGCNIFGKQ